MSRGITGPGRSIRSVVSWLRIRQYVIRPFLAQSFKGVVVDVIDIIIVGSCGEGCSRMSKECGVHLRLCRKRKKKKKACSKNRRLLRSGPKRKRDGLMVGQPICRPGRKTAVPRQSRCCDGGQAGRTERRGEAEAAPEEKSKGPRAAGQGVGKATQLGALTEWC
jgi:hypothetical protein